MQQTTRHTGRAIAAACLLLCPFAARAEGGVVNGVTANKIVAADGSGDFRTVQAALDAIPHGNVRPFIILIKPGTYKEKLKIASDQPFAHLIGAGKPEQTVLTFDDHATQPGPDGKPLGTFGTPSLFVKGHDFRAENLTFENSAAPRQSVGQAVAVAVEADRCVFEHCRFLGHQDTLYANKGRQLYRDCFLSGDVDFLFGNATAVFANCEIQLLGQGYVTAQSRTDPVQTTGYVLDHCRLTGIAPVGSVYLGRPWRPYARVVYLHCGLPDAIRPEGWNNWRDPAREKTAYFAEYDSRGAGSPPAAHAAPSAASVLPENAAPAGRVAWAHLLTPEEANLYAPAVFLKGDDNWNPDAQDMPAMPVMPPIALPQIAARTFDALKYGAIGDGRTLNTVALQKTMDACAQAGGGIVVVPPGRFLTGPLTLASGLNLRLEKGATLLFSDNIADYKLTNNRFQDCLVARKCHDVAITGGGTIDGQGAMWWKNYVKPKTAPPGTPDPPHRPYMVTLSECSRVLVEGVTLTNSPMFHLVPQKCQDVRIQNIRISSPEISKNTDGIDPSGWNFLITGCTFDVGDDCIALKPTAKIAPDQPACKNFLITHCTFLHGHGMSVGGQTPGGLDNLVVRDCTFRGTDAGIRLKAPRGAGGVVENLLYENLTMDGVKIPVLITSYYADSSLGSVTTDPAHDLARPVTDKTPIWRRIRIRNVTAINSKAAGQIYGLPEMPVSDITLTNVKLSGRKGMQIIHARDIRFENSHVDAQMGAPVILEDAQIYGLDRAGNSTAKTKDAGQFASMRAFDVRSYGAAGDGKTKDTAAIERAIADCVRSGGGRVLFTGGTYLTGPIQLRSGVDLHVMAGATVLFSHDHADYPLAVTHYEGLEAVRCRSPLWGENLHDVAITGEGVFDGQGETWRPAKKSKVPAEAWDALAAAGGYVDEASQTWWPSKSAFEGQTAVPALQARGSHRAEDYLPYRDFLRPTLVELSNCRHVTLNGPTFRNSPNWNIHLLLSDDITVRNITSFNPWWGQNGDGIDLDSCRRALVSNSVFNAGDDGICLKSGKNEEGRKLGRPTEDIQITNCTVYRGHGGVVIGSEMSGGVRNVTVKNCVFEGTDIGLRFKSTRGRGGMVENVRVDGLDMAHIAGAAISFDMYYMVKDPRPEPVSERTPRFQDFHIRNIVCESAQSALVIRGLPEMPIQDIALENVRIASDEGALLVDAHHITLRNVQVQAQSGPGLQRLRVEGLKLEHVQGLTEPRA